MTIRNTYPFLRIDDIFDQLSWARWLTKIDQCFRDLMSKVFQLSLGQFVMVFIDDILNYSISKKEHREYVCTVLETLQEQQPYVVFVKCMFWLQRLKFLGHVSAESIVIHPSR